MKSIACDAQPPTQSTGVASHGETRNSAAPPAASRVSAPESGSATTFEAIPARLSRWNALATSGAEVTVTARLAQTVCSTASRAFWSR